jgi:hypothetical protein
MSLFISSVFTYDEDAGNYIQAVETADAQALEPATRKAINNFVIGCKQDGIWTAIKASCILSGARTLAGALVPLAPVNNTTVATSSATGLISASRSASNLTTWRVSSSTGTFSTASVTDNTFGSIIVFARRDATIITHSNARLAFYSIGESLDLALLDARVTDLINAFAVTIP